MTPPDPSAIATKLSVPMRRALAAAQEDLFADRAVVVGHGMTIKALRTRRIVTRERPALLTAFGRAVIAAGQCGGGAASLAPAPLISPDLTRSRGSQS